MRAHPDSRTVGSAYWKHAVDYGSNALDVPPTGLDRFVAGNRKLLLSHGWADGPIPPNRP
jgi:hypothetical protein